MGDLIRIRQQVPVAKNRLQQRAYWEQQRAIAHAQMMMIGATVTTGLMMLGLAVLSSLQ
jgi:CHASE3 domain sensor protein